MPSMSFFASDLSPRIARRGTPRRAGTGGRAEHPVLGHRVRVLVRVRHAREELSCRRSGPGWLGRRRRSRAIRSCVVHMKVRDALVVGASSTSMIASRSWKRIGCARAFSSDMWFTPKNWLSPKSSRSIVQLPASRSLGRCGRGHRRLRLPSPGEPAQAEVRSAGVRRGDRRVRPTGARRRASPVAGGVRRPISGDHPVGDGRAMRSRSSPSSSPALDALHELLELGAVLLAAQVEADRLGELGRVPDVPAGPVARRAASRCRAGRPGSPGGRRRCAGAPERDLVVILRCDSSDQLTDELRGAAVG